jgi:hypothetical protein
MCHREEQLVSRGGEDNWRGYRDEDKKREELGNRQLHLPHLFRLVLGRRPDRKVKLDPSRKLPNLLIGSALVHIAGDRWIRYQASSTPSSSQRRARISEARGS